jgi:hypothetical protein
MGDIGLGKHDIDSTTEHTGVSGATEDNIISFDANGLPQDSGLADAALSGAIKGKVTVTIGDGSTVLTTGAKKIYVQIPYDGTITAATLLADQSGSVVVDIWKDTYANFPPTVADTITAAAKPTLSGAIKSTDSTLTGWTTSITAGDILEFNIDSVATIQKLIVILDIDKTGD